jgi:hypothetical protein
VQIISEIKNLVREQAFRASPTEVFDKANATKTLECDGHHVTIVFRLSVDNLHGRDVLCWKLRFFNLTGAEVPDEIGHSLIKSFFGGWHSLMEIPEGCGRCIVKPADDISFDRKNNIMSCKNSRKE